MTPKIYTKYEIAEILRDALIYNFWLLDEQYVLTTAKYLTQEGLQAYHLWLPRMLDMPLPKIYKLYIFDCDDWAIGYRQFCVMMHRRYHHIKAGLAIGFGIHRSLHHALNLAIILEENVPCVKVYEPQPSTLVDISDTLYYSEFSVVLL